MGEALAKDLSPALFEGLCRIGDNALILGHRVSEWCGHGPALEEDIALANLALDLIGHAEMWLGLAGEVEGAGRSADDLAYLRDGMAFRNVLLVELPKDDMAVTTMRQFLFDVYHSELLNALAGSVDGRVAEVAVKAAKEVAYHLERSSDLVVRLGAGSEESHRRMQDALDQLWPYCGEMFVADAVDAALAEAGVAPSPDVLEAPWLESVTDILEEATLAVPEQRFDVHQGGRIGRHTEHLGLLLAEMQFLQRAYPGAEW